MFMHGMVVLVDKGWLGWQRCGVGGVRWLGEVIWWLVWLFCGRGGGYSGGQSLIIVIIE